MADTTTLAAPNLSREELVSKLRALRPFFEREGVTRMTLFGSRARGDPRPDSDVDLIIEVDPKAKFSLLDLVGVGHIVDDHFGLKGDIQMRRSLRPYLADEAGRDGIDVF
jgi:predicted nucleotidyltransferase